MTAVGRAARKRGPTMTGEQEWPGLTGILEIIEGLVRKHGSVNAAARACGMPQATLHNIRNGAEPTVSTLKLIAAHMDMPLWKLMRRIEEEETSND